MKNSKKSKPKDGNTDELAVDEQTLLSTEEVFDVLQFASSVYKGTFNPFLSNDAMKNISLSPQAANAEKVERALQNPNSNEENLIGYSEFFEITSMMYKRILLYLSGMLSFDLTYVPINAEPSDFKKKRYKDDVKILEDFLDRFDVKKEFGIAIREMMRKEAYFTVLRDEGNTFTLQELNSKYCLITGRFEKGLLFDFDFGYFLNPGIDISGFPSIFKKIYNKIFEKIKGTDNAYRPSAPLNERTGTFAYWSQVSPSDGFWAFKFSPELATRIPFLAPMFPDVVLQPLMRKLQTNSHIASASKILTGEVPLLNKDLKGGTVRDSIAITPDTLGKFLALMKAGLSDAVKVAVAPLTDIKAQSFPTEAPFYDEFLKTTASSSGVNSRLIFTLDKNNAIESQLSINVDEYLMEFVYVFFADFLDYHINKRTSKYKFKFFFEGTKFFTNRKERLETQKTLMGFGMVNHQKIAASVGMLPHHFIKQLEMTKSMGFVENLTPVLMGAQMPSDDVASKSGRPRKELSELDDSGVQTRDDASNEERDL